VSATSAARPPVTMSSAKPLYSRCNLAECVLWQHRRQRGRKVYSLHAPEVECIGKGKSHRPYEFGASRSASPLR
jgi:transposase, IS5 family